MSKIKVKGHDSGTGVITIEAPNTSTDRVITLPDSTATLATTDINSFTGDTTITSGDIVFATAGKGICLGVTSNTDANTLDDYEEGTWTPTVTCHTSGSFTLDSGANLAAYTKIGRTVHIQGSLSITGESSPNGQLRISLPFTSFDSTDDTDYSFGHGNLANHGGTLACQNMNFFVPNNVSYGNLWSVKEDGTTAYIDHTDVDTNFQISFQMSYIAA